MVGVVLAYTVIVIVYQFIAQCCEEITGIDN